MRCPECGSAEYSSAMLTDYVEFECGSKWSQGQMGYRSERCYADARKRRLHAEALADDLMAASNNHAAEVLELKERIAYLMENNTLNQWRDKAHGLAIEKKWYERDRDIPELCMLVVTELSELTEAFRNRQLHKPCDKDIDLSCIEEEFADVLIRMFDFAGAYNVDLDRAVEKKHRYNQARPPKHGKIA